MACASPNAAGALLTYAEAEAAELIRQNLHIVSALIDAIIEHGTLTGGEGGAIVAQARAAEGWAG